MFDYTKLKGRIIEKGFTQESLADKMGKRKAVLDLKLNNQSEFIQDEINKIVEILEIPVTEIKEYFFTKRV